MNFKKIGKTKTRISVAVLGFLNLYLMIFGHTYFGWDKVLCDKGMALGSGLAIAYITGRSATGAIKSWNGNYRRGSSDEEEIDV